MVGCTITLGSPEEASEAAAVSIGDESAPTITVRETTTVVTSEPLDSPSVSETPNAVVSSLNISLNVSPSEGLVVVSRGLVCVRVTKVEF